MKKVLLLLADGFETIEASVFIDVRDDQIITSWNPSTAFDVAFLLLELLTTRKNADQVRALLGFEVEL